MNPRDVIKAINNATKPFLMYGGNSFCLTEHNKSNLRLKVFNNVSKAYNSYGKDGEHVNVVKWFDDFWLFVEIQFLNPTGTKISLSIFQGDETDPIKCQLFRVEWDDYGDEITSHPQPHWHFLTNKMVEDSAKEFAELLPEMETFKEFLDEEIHKVIDLSKFHFAMHADWTNSKLHTHKINNENQLSSWFGGLLAYLKDELEFLSNKRAVKF